MEDSFNVLGLLIVVSCALITVSQGGLPEVLERCCDVGRQWFTTNRETCTTYPSPVSGVQTSDRAICTSVVDVCCIAQRNVKQCSIGKQSARIRRSCDGLSSRPGSEQARECCHCCNLGITANEAGSQCDLMSQFSASCAAAYQECCEFGRQPPPNRTLTSSSGDDRSQDAFPVAVPATTVQPAIGGSDSNQLGICAKFPGQLCAHVCINTPDSYECACHDGFTLQSDRRTCRQETSSNRCDVNNPCQHRCVDTGLAVHCQCMDGYLLEADGRSCRDIDECALNQHTCTPQQRCVNIEGSFSCEASSGPTVERCTTGYAWSRDTERCEDIDECTVGRENPCAREPGQFCYNTQGSYTCRYRVTAGDRISGPTGTDDRQDERAADDDADNDGENSVVDVPDVAPPTTVRAPVPATERSGGRHHHSHHHNRHQVDTGSSSGLNCGTGFMYNRATGRCEDINECAMSRDTCVEGQTCENTVGSYSCRRAVSCGTGYTLDQQSQMCLDDDECTLGIHNCGVARECHNIPGSFRCLPRQCPRGYRLDQRSGSCDPVVCARGHQADEGGNCVDINECIERPNVCRPNQECRNTQGSYTCRNLLTCGPGFELNSDGSRCEDVDECARGEHDCTGVLMHCVNRQGSYLCQCADGFQVNYAQRTCEDIDECSFGGQVCAQNAACENTHGSYRCMCKEGFEDDADRQSCRDIDECARQGMCQHTCRNTWGSFQCSCDEGYQLSADGRTCDDIDECREAADRGLHVCIGVCENTHGSFACTCPSGYQMATDGRTCQDIDECALRATSCNGADDVCVNTRGGSKCLAVTCPKGFIKAPATTNRNNNVKCQRKTFLCPQGDVECLYAPLSYSTNFLTFDSKVRIPADLFTMRGPLSPYRRLVFDLKLIKAEDPSTGDQRVGRSHFTVNQLRDNEAVIQLLREIEGPQDIELQLDMNIYSREFRQNDEEVFFGTAVAKIFIFVTSENW